MTIEGLVGGKRAPLKSYRRDTVKNFSFDFDSLENRDMWHPQLFDFDRLENCGSWPSQLAARFDDYVAAAFAVGIELLAHSVGDALDGDKDPFLIPYMPQEYVNRYDHAFFAKFRDSVQSVKEKATSGRLLFADSVAEELVLCMASIMANIYIEMKGCDMRYTDELSSYWKNWVQCIIGDNYLYVCLYADIGPPSAKSAYHFNHWFEKQFSLKDCAYS
jgi:hypothetical protein